MLALNGSIWRCASPVRAALSAVVALSLGAGNVRAAIVPADPASASYHQGASDRDAWEAWLSSLTGSTLAGAASWTTERSRAGVASCGSHAANGDDWLTGCTEAKRRLTPIDVKRKTDAQYWNGWNKLGTRSNTQATTSPVVAPGLVQATGSTTRGEYGPSDIANLARLARACQEAGNRRGGVTPYLPANSNVAGGNLLRIRRRRIYIRLDGRA